MRPKIGIIQFPGSNTERETSMACTRVGLTPVDFLWNDSPEYLSKLDGYIIVGGFSYEDRSRAGIIAALEPIIERLKIECKAGKPILGICNGAQILVESGMVPGLKGNQCSIALADNKRIKNGKVVGVGYYNTWVNMRLSALPERSAFTRHLKQYEHLTVPVAHAEGRFLIPDALLKQMVKNEQVLYQYCDRYGKVLNEFPTNPNGSILNIAAISNTAGNVMAMMPHPERTEQGDVIFSSIKEFIESGYPVVDRHLDLNLNLDYKLRKFSLNKTSEELLINLIITDNEEVSVSTALKGLGHNLSIIRQQHWEIETDGSNENIMKEIFQSGELFNSNKEYIGKRIKNEKTVSILVRQKEDIYGRMKLESLRERFGISGIRKITSGVVWNLSSNESNIRSNIHEILNTNIIHNPLSHECYKIN